MKKLVILTVLIGIAVFRLSSGSANVVEKTLESVKAHNALFAEIK